MSSETGPLAVGVNLYQTEFDPGARLHAGARYDDNSAAGALMVPDPKRIDGRALVVQALRQMEENPGGAITQLVVVDERGGLVGAVHMHDIVKLGLATPPPA